MPGGRVVIFDDDHYYMGGVLAELLVNNGCSVTLVTPARPMCLSGLIIHSNRRLSTVDW